MGDAERYWSALTLTMGRIAYSAAEGRLLPVVLLALPFGSRPGAEIHLVTAPGVRDEDVRGLLVDALAAVDAGRVVEADTLEGR